MQRTLKYCKYLPEFGWQSYVVCSDAPDAFGDGLDPSLLAETPTEAKVWRRAFVNPLGLRGWAHKLLDMKPGGEIPTQNQHAMTGKQDMSKGIRGLAQALASLLAAFEFPAVDAALYWAFAILPGCVRLIRTEKIDVIYSTSFPYSDHVAGWLLKRLSGLPWVADFRDPWTQNAGVRNRGWRYRIDQWVEQRVLHSADRVIGVTPSYTANLLRLAPNRPAEHFMTIENGYDKDDFISADYGLADLGPAISSQNMLAKTAIDEAQPPDQPIKLAHVGYLYDGTALPFFRALEALGEMAARLHVRFMGGLPAQEQGWLENHAIAAKIFNEPRRPHQQAIQAMRSATVLLLFVLADPIYSGHYPGKLFEYMASGTPILLIGPEGEAAELIRRSGVGCFSSTADPQGIMEILRLVATDPNAFRDRYYRPQPQVIAGYERRVLTFKLASMFNELAISNSIGNLGKENSRYSEKL